MTFTFYLTLDVFVLSSSQKMKHLESEIDLCILEALHGEGLRSGALSTFPTINNFHVVFSHYLKVLVTFLDPLSCRLMCLRTFSPIRLFVFLLFLLSFNIMVPARVHL